MDRRKRSPKPLKADDCPRCGTKMTKAAVLYRCPHCGYSPPVEYGWGPRWQGEIEPERTIDVVDQINKVLK